MENLTDYDVPKHVNAAFANQLDAEKAYNELITRGYSPEDINVLLANENQKIHVEPDNDDHSESKTLEKAGVGSAIGGTAGAVIGIFATLGTAVLVPPLGLAVAGPLIAAFAGAGAGGITGGIIGALVGSGVSQEHAEIYETTIKNGGVIISFTPRTVQDRIEIITSWNDFGAKQLHGNENFTE